MPSDGKSSRCLWQGELKTHSKSVFDHQVHVDHPVQLQWCNVNKMKCINKRLAKCSILICNKVISNILLSPLFHLIRNKVISNILLSPLFHLISNKVISNILLSPLFHLICNKVISNILLSPFKFH